MRIYSHYKLFFIGIFLALNFSEFAQNLSVEYFEKKLLETSNAFLLDVRPAGEFCGSICIR